MIAFATVTQAVEAFQHWEGGASGKGRSREASLQSGRSGVAVGERGNVVCRGCWSLAQNPCSL